jgi:oxygen-independent coproporphyrinogen-3 oxidase
MYSLYLHVPFCVHRCAYCDFNTYAGQGEKIPGYVEALESEIRAVAGSAGQRLPAHTIFFGGGTPSLLSPLQFRSILRTIRQSFTISEDAEISLEANPGTLDLNALQELYLLGFKRISLGVQSAHPQELHQLERIHDYFDIIEAVRWARKAGFRNLNLDLIYGLPEQTLERWKSNIELVLGLLPEHLSLYALTIEPGTPLGHWAAKGKVPIPDPDLAADMYEWAGERLNAAGYEHYEISNWAKPGFQCRHNLQYWRGNPYLGFGAGAHGFAAGVRYSNSLRIKTYMERCLAISTQPFPLSPAAVNSHAVSHFAEMQEAMMTGLRLTQEGVSANGFEQRYGCLREGGR